MKKIIGFIIISILFLNLVACKKTVDDEPLDLSYGFLLDIIWEQYLIQSMWNDSLDIEGVDELIVLGTYRYNKDLGEEYSDRYYLGDEKIDYRLDIIITFDETSDNDFQHFRFDYRDTEFLEAKYISKNYAIEAIDQNVELDEYIKTLKTEALEEKEELDEHYSSLMTEDSIHESEFIEDRYQIEEITHYINTIVDIKLVGLIYYMIGETEASVVGYDSSESYGNYEIASEIDGKPVTKIYENAFRYAEINTLSIPHSIKEFGYESFAEATIRSIEIEQESQLRIIRELAFLSSTCKRVNYTA